jgi:outer membrane translocation and assembly module TamA
MFSLDANIGWFNLPFGINNQLITDADLFLTGIGVTIGYNSFLGPIRCSFMVPAYSEGGIPRKLRTFLHIGHRF